MLEAPTNTKTRDALERAHQERGQALLNVWNWLFHTTTD